jgi:hypothetical protein
VSVHVAFASQFAVPFVHALIAAHVVPFPA